MKRPVLPDVSFWRRWDSAQELVCSGKLGKAAGAEIQTLEAGGELEMRLVLDGSEIRSCEIEMVLFLPSPFN